MHRESTHPSNTLAEDRTRNAAMRPQCWICRSTNTRLFKRQDLLRPLTPKDLMITDSAYGVTLQLQRCNDCGFIFANQDEILRLVTLYEQLEDPAYEETQAPRSLQMRWLLRPARRLHPRAKTLLDIGAGTGLLVAEARRAGYHAVGVEPSRALVKAAARLHKVDLLQGVYPHPALEGRRFDLIFLVDVIEHVANPLELLEACRRALAASGILIVVTPDAGSLTARLLGHRWWHFRLAHVGYFNKQSFKRMAENSHLELIHQSRPPWFFRAEYLAQRLTRYLPVGWINSLAGRVAIVRRLYDTIIPLNPRDSMLVVLRRAA